MKTFFLLTLLLGVFAHPFVFAGESTKKAKTTAKTAPMKDCTDTTKYQTLNDCFQIHEEANHGFKMIHKDSNGNEIKTKYVVVLVHGLSDSPYFYRDLSQIMFNEGLNVFAIRSTGHGTEAHHLRDVQREQWYKDVEWGKEQASKYGKNIILGGMSLGGALVIHNALKTKSYPIKGMMLFSPAIAMPWKFRLVCLRKGKYRAEKTYGVGVRYQGISNNGTCELYKLNNEILSHKTLPKPRRRHHHRSNLGRHEMTRWRMQNRRAVFPSLNFPVFNVLSVYDTAINIDIAYEFSKKVKSANENKSKLVLYTNFGNTDAKGKSLDQDKLPNDVVMIDVDKMAHASVLLRPSDNDFTPETNPQFAQMAKAMRQFIQENFK